MQDLKLKREECSLCLLSGLGTNSELINSQKGLDSKVIAVGGYKDPVKGDYQSWCEILDLENDAWETNAWLNKNRLKPFLVQVGRDSVLVVGGHQRNVYNLRETLIKDLEVIDTTV